MNPRSWLMMSVFVIVFSEPCCELSLLLRRSPRLLRGDVPRRILTRDLRKEHQEAFRDAVLCLVVQVSTVIRPLGREHVYVRPAMLCKCAAAVRPGALEPREIE